MSLEKVSVNRIDNNDVQMKKTAELNLTSNGRLTELLKEGIDDSFRRSQRDPPVWINQNNYVKTKGSKFLNRYKIRSKVSKSI